MTAQSSAPLSPTAVLARPVNSHSNLQLELHLNKPSSFRTALPRDIAILALAAFFNIWITGIVFGLIHDERSGPVGCLGFFLPLCFLASPGLDGGCFWGVLGRERVLKEWDPGFGRCFWALEGWEDDCDGWDGKRLGLAVMEGMETPGFCWSTERMHHARLHKPSLPTLHIDDKPEAGGESVRHRRLFAGASGNRMRT